jgi:type IV/VI secretion system ImpK/VasF family protein
MSHASTSPSGTDPTHRGDLAAAAGRVFSLLFVLRQSQDLDGFQDLPGRVVEQIEDFRRAARDRRLPEPDIEDATYALAATLDESMLTRTWNGRDGWQAQSLSQRYCNNEFVGLGFYDKLAQVRRSAPPRTDVKEVFYYCLISGFKGKLVETPKELADITDQLGREIAPKQIELAPHIMAKEGRLEPLRRFPWIAVILGCVTLPFLVWLVSWEVLDGRADKIVKTLETFRF